MELFSIANWVHSFEGLLHFTASIIGLLSGAYLLIAKKGSRAHKVIGRIFGFSVLIVNISALFIYDFNQGRISPFHFLIPVSLFFLIYGWLPMLFAKRTRRTINRHIIGMTGASLGLWAAGATEYFVREIVNAEMEKSALILYSFLISLPFGILIGLLITIQIKRQKSLG
ncbi:MAG: DUF2306 domain-containing protein [Bacteroidetes bacterium]|nr:DUF2306 domain-containing protein [Bacteroidota bacterium]